MQGLKEGKADDMLAAFNIKTIEQLGAWKHYQAAQAISVLASTEEAGKRPEGAASNVNGIVDKAYEASSFKEVLAAPPSALQGLAPWWVVDGVKREAARRGGGVRGKGRGEEGQQGLLLCGGCGQMCVMFRRASSEP